MEATLAIPSSAPVSDARDAAAATAIAAARSAVSAHTGTHASGTAHQCVFVSASAQPLTKKRGEATSSGVCTHALYLSPSAPTCHTSAR